MKLMMGRLSSVLPIALGATAMCVSIFASAKAQQAPDVVRASRICVVDEQGRDRILLMADHNGSSIHLVSAEGETLVTVSALNETNGIWIRQGDGWFTASAQQGRVYVSAGVSPVVTSTTGYPGLRLIAEQNQKDVSILAIDETGRGRTLSLDPSRD